MNTATLSPEPDGVPVAHYRSGEDVLLEASPRPYLEARTLRSNPVTDERPPDHTHHLGVSVAIPDVSNVSFWGGRTFVHGKGSVLLSNHGVQNILRRVKSHDELLEHLEWVAPDGRVLLTERRRIRVTARDEGWQLTWQSDLSAGQEGASIGSPHTNGRTGAFYGGIFWRTPFNRADVHCAEGSGAAVSHGSTSPWIAISSSSTSIVAWNDGRLPWFVRAAEYVGFGPALAADRRLDLAPSESVRLDLTALVFDRPVTSEQADAMFMESHKKASTQDE